MAMDLPDLVLFCGDWQAYEDRVYSVYFETIIQSNLRFNNLPVRPRYTPETKGKHFGFWHMVQEGDVEEERTPDLRRCERIGWVSWVIENCIENSEISWWVEKRDNQNEIVIWIEAEQYVVVLSERRDYWLLKTSYLATKSGKIKQLERNRAKYAKPRKN
ncbi:hypothetical protein RO575_04895 [Methylomonas sp. MO1]|uniref:hypothetical protein n=2 Tax=unclassified Methylomonas TaxID=2608980 RepID=UPI0028A51F3E|nr:hypothetical protein [Methylomonas sp. MO1]MDT4288884.1 hypothetical protein [Methylomonas sp. MO1]